MDDNRLLNISMRKKFRVICMLLFLTLGFIRIIPAYAGNSALYMWSLIYDRDHPRIRGEQTKQIPSNQQSKIAKLRFYINLDLAYQTDRSLQVDSLVDDGQLSKISSMKVWRDYHFS